MTIAIVGTGLIGGSMALTLRHNGFASRILGVDREPRHLEQALERGLIDEAMDLDAALALADILVLAVPVDALLQELPGVLSRACAELVLEVGSTKQTVLKAVKNHPARRILVSAHPMAGTEYSGPAAAVDDLFRGRTTVICDQEDSGPRALGLALELFGILGSRVVHMDSASHDLHAAYVSHISHISSFALAATVLEKEKEEEAIFELAGGGFASTVRLAKSSPEMWVPIFAQNRTNVLDVLYEHIHQLKRIKQMLLDEDYEGFYRLIRQANEIRRIIP